ncbi:MAG TPA: orotidine-5'-phosphate decarboxylase [Candidatus Thermoplasmatota archaeon]|nr:orotidine-5'-phosphate decarboxylase [Candidatus Thermoplasmatota archaeon]
MDWREKLSSITSQNNSLLCVGLDSDTGKIPKFLMTSSKNPLFDFNKEIIDATKDLVCAYKLNMAFYEVAGNKGILALEKTIRYIPHDILIILDGKRNDIGNTAQKYAQSLFDILNADAATINPYLGKDGVNPFLEYKEKCCFILCRTSNPSAGDFQDLLVSSTPMYQIVARKIREWDTNKNCGAVVGATYPGELKTVRSILGDDIPILIPGIGKQGGDVEKTVRNGTNSHGEMVLINSSREIIFAGDNEDFAGQARKKAESVRNDINKYR